MANPTGAIVRDYRLLGTALSIRAEGGDLDWLEEFLGPGLEAGGGGGDPVRIEFGRAARSRRRGAAGAPVVAFALDSGPVRAAPVATPRGVAFVSERGSTEFEVCDGGRRVAVRYADDRANGRFHLMRVVREYAHNHAVRSGAVVLHAAALAFDGVALGIAGPKRSGKTTLLLRALRTPKTQWISNDRLAVRPARAAGAAPVAEGIGSVIGLREGTRALFAPLAARLDGAGDYRRHSREREARGAGRMERSGGAWLLSAPQVCAALERPVRAAAPLAALVFLEPRGADPKPRRLGLDAACEAIAANRMGRASDVLVSDLFVAGDVPPPSAAVLRDAGRALAARVPCVWTTPDVAPKALFEALRAWRS